MIVPILDVLWEAVKRRLLALGLERIISFSGGLFGDSGELASKCVPSQKIQNRVHTAIKAGQAPCHLVSGIHSIIKTAHVWTLEVQSSPHVQVLHDMEGQIGDGEHCENDDDQVN